MKLSIFHFNLRFNLKKQINKMNQIKTERIEFEYNESYVMCRYCQVKITPANKALPRMDHRENEICNQEQQIQNLEAVVESLKQELEEKDRKL
jgi:hypothetical protein